MKFLRIFIALIALLTIVTSRRAHNFYNTQISQESTSYTTAKGGLIYYLDRQKPACANGSGMSYFKLDTDGTNYKYAYNCINSEAISTSSADVRSLNTPMNGYNTGMFQDFSVNFLDRHAVMCGAGEVLKSFQLGRDAGHDNINYQYKCVKAQTLCCKDHSTTHSSMKSRKTFDLQHQKVGTAASSTMVLKGFKLWSNSDNDDLWYTYRTCKLKDMQAEKVVAQLQRDYTKDSNSLTTAKTAYETLSNRTEDARKLVADLEAELSTAQSHAGLKASC
jgi:hypothetical protein